MKCNHTKGELIEFYLSPLTKIVNKGQLCESGETGNPDLYKTIFECHLCKKTFKVKKNNPKWLKAILEQI